MGTRRKHKWAAYSARIRRRTVTSTGGCDGRSSLGIERRAREVQFRLICLVNWIRVDVGKTNTSLIVELWFLSGKNAMKIERIFSVRISNLKFPFSFLYRIWRIKLWRQTFGWSRWVQHFHKSTALSSPFFLSLELTRFCGTSANTEYFPNTARLARLRCGKT